MPLATASPDLHLAWKKTGDTFYDAATPPEFVAEDMSLSATENLIEQLRNIWASSPELLALIPQFDDLAELIANESGDDDDGPDTPSTLVYQMW